MLGGTLTATFLALSDARPDLATLSAVGAAPRTRRGVAASYAAGRSGWSARCSARLVGFVPGVAVTYPLTSNALAARAGPRSHYLDVPWLMVIGVVLGAAAADRGAWSGCVRARSRLPLVSPAGLSGRSSAPTSWLPHVHIKKSVLTVSL